MRLFLWLLCSVFTGSMFAEGADALVTCPQCRGIVPFVCAVPGCKGGKVPCPGPCLKKDQGEWIHMKMPGHADTELWQRFYHPDGSSWKAWTQAHIGEKIEVRGGKYENTGKCERCKGTTRVDCTLCKGESECPLCKGDKRVLRSEAELFASLTSPPSAPKPAAPPAANASAADPKDGKIVARGNGFVMIRTSEGKLIKVPAPTPEKAAGQ